MPTQLDLSTTSLLLQPHRLTREQLAKVAKRGEAAGLDALWVVESTTDAFVFAHEILSATERVKAGSAIAARWKRHPMQMAEAAASIDHLYPGRFSIGVGSAGWVGDRRLAWGDGLDRAVGRMAEYLEILRPALAGRKIDFAGEFYEAGGRIAFDRATQIPVRIAAGGVQLGRLAGRMADGAFIEFGSRHRFAQITAELRAAAFAAGRDANGMRIDQVVPACFASDAGAARTTLRGVLLEYGLGDAGVLGGAGHAEMERSIADLLEAGDDAGAASVLTDEVVDQFALTLTPGDSATEVTDRLAGLRAPEATHLTLYPFPGGETDWATGMQGTVDLLSSLSEDHEKQSLPV